MRILLFGSTGKVGKELRIKLFNDHHEVIMMDRAHQDLLNQKHLVEAIVHAAPQIIINAAAYNGMEDCETHPEKAYLINAVAPAMMAIAAHKCGARLIHYSTDYVFNGGNWHDEDPRDLREDTLPKPNGVYARTKFMADCSIPEYCGNFFIFRVTTVYGRALSGPLSPLGRANIYREDKIRGKLPILPQVCTPTSARLIAHATVHAMAKTAPATLYNLATTEPVLRLDFIQALLAHYYGGDWEYEDFLPALKRPTISLLNCDKFQSVFQYQLPTWQEDFGTTAPLIKGLPNARHVEVV